MRHVLLIDNYDSFAYNLYDYLLQAGVRCTVLRNDAFELDDLKSLDFQGIVLSPGPKRPHDAGLLMPLVAHYHDKVPMLGVCLGHQALGLYFGAELVKARLPMHGKTSRLHHTGHALFEGIPSPSTVMRYHSLLLPSLDGTCLLSIAHSEEGEIMALAHPTLPLFGVQYHPESILTEHGHTLLRNFLDNVGA
jgi:anthranilate synthase/aminodeoxychorismate synthase-like glutamine amidotransferase